MKNLFIFLTVLALVFLASVAGYFAFTKVTDDCSTRRFQDRGLGLDFEYGCDWELNLNTRISETFVFDEDQEVFGPIAENYEISLVHKDNDSEVSFKKFLQAGDGSVRSFDDEDEYEIISDKIVRFEDKDIWTYVEYYSCSDVPEVFRNGAKDCGSSFFPEFGKFATIVSTTESDNENLEEVDELIKDITE
jgi:hypothetical protein